MIEELITLHEAARRIGVSDQTLRLALQRQTFPVGVALYCARGARGRWRYIIPRKAFEKWLGYEKE